MGDGLDEALSAVRAGRLSPEQRMTRDQEQLASEGMAVGQCPHCGSYRADGRPPILHEPDCSSYGVIPDWSIPGAS